MSTCRSSPDLITSVLDRYRLAVAEAELRTAAVASQKTLQIQQQHLSGTTQTGEHWQAMKGCGNYMLPSPPPINIKPQVFVPPIWNFINRYWNLIT